MNMKAKILLVLCVIVILIAMITIIECTYEVSNRRIHRTENVSTYNVEIVKKIDIETEMGVDAKK